MAKKKVKAQHKRRGRPKRGLDDWACQVLWEYAHEYPFFAWVRWWSEGFEFEEIDNEAHRVFTVFPKPYWPFGFGKGIEKLVYGRPEENTIDLLARRHNRSPHTIRKYLKLGRRLLPDLEEGVRLLTISGLLHDVGRFHGRDDAWDLICRLDRKPRRPTYQEILELREKIFGSAWARIPT